MAHHFIQLGSCNLFEDKQHQNELQVIVIGSKCLTYQFGINELFY